MKYRKIYDKSFFPKGTIYCGKDTNDFVYKPVAYNDEYIYKMTIELIYIVKHKLFGRELFLKIEEGKVIEDKYSTVLTSSKYAPFNGINGWFWYITNKNGYSITKRDGNNENYEVSVIEHKFYKTCFPIFPLKKGKAGALEIKKALETTAKEVEISKEEFNEIIGNIRGSFDRTGETTYNKLIPADIEEYEREQKKERKKELIALLNRAKEMDMELRELKLKAKTMYLEYFKEYHTDKCYVDEKEVIDFIEGGELDAEMEICETQKANTGSQLIENAENRYKNLNRIAKRKDNIMNLLFADKDSDMVYKTALNELGIAEEAFIAPNALQLNKEETDRIKAALPTVQFKEQGLDNRSEKTAEMFNILGKVQKLEADLLKIEGVVKVEFDLDGFYDDMKQVIFLPKYDIPVSAENYFELRKNLVNEVLAVAKENGLSRTGDSIEDYGEHLYIVTRHDDTWKPHEKSNSQKKDNIER